MHCSAKKKANANVILHTVMGCYGNQILYLLFQSICILQITGQAILNNSVSVRPQKKVKDIPRFKLFVSSLFEQRPVGFHLPVLFYQPSILIFHSPAIDNTYTQQSRASQNKKLHYLSFLDTTKFGFIHSFHWYVQNATIPCHSQELLPFLSVMYFFCPPFSANYFSILSHLILSSISWSTSQSCCSQNHIQYPFRNPIFFHSLYMPKPM